MIVFALVYELAFSLSRSQHDWEAKPWLTLSSLISITDLPQNVLIVIFTSAYGGHFSF